MVDSCQKCEYCTESEEQYCVTGSTFTYGADLCMAELVLARLLVVTAARWLCMSTLLC
jgi:D-arabinose 1-dehydrogenase-like Zn-dependent alcohol dehydrogenase